MHRLLEQAEALRTKIYDAYATRWLNANKNVDHLRVIYADYNDFLFALGMQQCARLDDNGQTYTVTQPHPLAEPLADLIEYVTSGRRYESRNPYGVPGVEQALKALIAACGKQGGDWLDALEVYRKTRVE